MSPRFSAQPQEPGEVGDSGKQNAEQRRLEAVLADLAERERLLRAVISNAPLILYALDRNGVITMTEGRGLAELGRSPGDHVGQSVDEVYRDEPDVLACCRQALKGETVTATVVVQGRSYDTTCTPMHGPAGEVTGVIGVSTDVTERARSEEALRQGTERFQRSFEHAAFGKGIVDPSGRWLQVNQALCSMLGYTESELLSLTFQDVTHPDDLESDVVLMRQMLAGDITGYQLEKRYVHKLGHVVWILLSVSLVTDAGGAPLYSVSEVQDITARKQAEEDVQRQHARLQTIIATQREIGTSDLTPNVIMDIIIERTRLITGAEIAGVGLVDGDDLVFHAFTDPAVVGTRVKLDASLAGRSVRTGELLVSGNIDEDPRVDHAAARSVGSKSVMTIPLQHSGSVIGAVVVSSPRLQAFAEHDVEALQLIAGQLSAAMSHAAQRVAEQEVVRQARALQQQAELLDLAHDAIFVRHIETAEIQFWNRGAEQTYGIPRAMALGVPAHVLLRTVFPQPLSEIVRAVTTTGLWEGELLHTTGDGMQVTVASRWALQRNERAEPVAILEINRDISLRKRAEEALRRSEDQFRALVEASPVGVSIINPNGIVEQVNTSFEALLGYAPGQIIGHHHSVFFPTEERGFLASVREERFARGVQTLDEFELLRADGTRVTVLMSSVPLPGLDGVPRRAAFIMDISDRKRAEEALAGLLAERTATLEVVEHRALHDALTDLPNRTLIYNRLEHTIRTAHRDDTRFALLFVDLDRFKQVNDTLGHRVGDALLCHVADRLRQTLRESDTVARLGGDEFAILLPGTETAGALRVAGKILEALGPPAVVDDHRLDIGASVGVALYPDHAQTADELMQRADVAMYVAKRDGTGPAMYAPELDASETESGAIEGQKPWSRSRDTNR